MRTGNKGPLGRALVQQVRVVGDLAARWFSTHADPEGSAAAWTRRGTLVIVANGRHADRIAGELERAGLLVPQRDKPEHLQAGVA